MSRLTEILNEIEVPTHELRLESIQNLLLVTKKVSSTHENPESWNKVTKVLWNHLIEGLTKLDDQLLCATCFYAVLALTDKQEPYLNKICTIIQEELDDTNRTLQSVSLMYGLFQSSFLIQKNDNHVQIAAILQPVFDLLLLKGYEYSQYTFLIFKTIKSFKKVCGTIYLSKLFIKDNQIRLLNFVNHNWENPMTGVRDMNRYIFQTLISTLEDSIYETILKEVNNFYWNKAKYLMLSEIIEVRRGSLSSLIHEYKWIDGIIHSLYKPGLVSAGADMYYAILKQIKSEDEWCRLFLQNIKDILNGSNSKAIENFNNYWFLTTLKKFPELIHIFLKVLHDMSETEQVLMSKLCVLKQGKKTGILEQRITDSNFQHTVMRGIQHCNSHLRMLAFDVICYSPGRSAPSQSEYELVLSYITNNINSDCTVLRISMLNSLDYFLTELHSTFLNVMTKSENEHTNKLVNFSKRLQEIIVNCFKLNGNYQRKIAMVKLCNIVWCCFTTIPKKKKDQIRQIKMRLVDYLKDKESWLLSRESFVLDLLSLLKDPADDIRENVANLLLNYYHAEISEVSIMKLLINDAVTSIKNKYFYEISCGQTIFKLITNLIIKQNKPLGEFKTVEDIFYFAYNQLIAEHDKRTDIMTSIETGKQLHSLMSITIVVLEACISRPYKLEISNIMPEFLNVLEDVSNQFVAEQDSCTSSDFSKMNDMVESIIVKSGFYADSNDQTKISGLHQIVLNCLWLNVKASCDLASLLVQINGTDIGMCEKCLNIITHVLETSRHKGAIEAAGSALGRSINYLTSRPLGNQLSKLPNKLLKQKLNDLISETNKMSSITRRGAGLSIMVHRIVSSDMKKGKPLFHYFIKTLLKMCSITENVAKNNEDGNLENQVDLPQAIYIHFMTRIVTDSSLASDLMYYSASLAQLAFTNLTSTHWQIRNAALQLYGALIPRQIGQKKASGSDEETIATVSCDELRTHSPNVWKFFLELLKQNNSGSDTLQCHSNLIPILNLLASIAKRYNFSYDLMEQKVVDDELLNHLVLLLGSPIHTVRRLTAKCVFNIYELEDINKILIQGKFMSENSIHGSLILLNLCIKHYGPNALYAEKLKHLKKLYCEILNSGHHSYQCRLLFEEINIDHNENNLNLIRETMTEMNVNSGVPGVHLWAELRFKKIISICSWKEIPAVLKLILHQNDYEKYCEMICMKMENDTCEETQVYLEIVYILLSFEKKYQSSIIWRIIYEISQKICLTDKINVSSLLQHLEDKFLYKLRYMIPLIANNIQEDQSNFIKCIERMSDFENSDVDMRYIAATANNHLAKQINSLQDSCKVSLIKCAIMLLQDEDEDVRNLSVEFYKIITKQDIEIQPYICLNNIMTRNFLQDIFEEPTSSIQNLCTELTQILQLNHAVDSYSPFANDSKNIYFEPEVLKELITKLI